MREGIIDHTEVGWTINAQASGGTTAQGAIGPVPAGYIWYVERYTTFNPRANSVCELFALNSEKLPANFTAAIGDRAGRLDVSITANNAAADNASPLVIPEGYWLVAFWSGLTDGDKCQLTTQIAVHQKLLATMDKWQQAELQGGGIPDNLNVPTGLGEAFTQIPGQPVPAGIPGSNEGGLTDA